MQARSTERVCDLHVGNGAHLLQTSYSQYLLCVHVVHTVHTLCTLSNGSQKVRVVRTGSHIVYTQGKKYAQSLQKVCTVRTWCAQWSRVFSRRIPSTNYVRTVHTLCVLDAHFVRTVHTFRVRMPLVRSMRTKNLLSTLCVHLCALCTPRAHCVYTCAHCVHLVHTMHTSSISKLII